MIGIGRWLEHPLARKLDVDDPRTTNIRKQIVLGKPFLRRIYLEWYDKLIRNLPKTSGIILELGSGAGFFRERLPEAITSDAFLCQGIDAVIDARRLPFEKSSLRSIVMTDVMHHIPEVERFLTEASRVLRPGGRLMMIEPWVSAWSKLVYGHFHPEPFIPGASNWSFPATGPLSGANGAIPWMVFSRDADRFKRLFPELRVSVIEPFMPFRYLLSGGVSLRSLAPNWSFVVWREFERLLLPAMPLLAMFAFIRVDRE
jgi:SAM-dependent methyltransferase